MHYLEHTLWILECNLLHSSYFSAIKHILKQDGYVWDDNKAALSYLVKGCQFENDTVKIRLPIQLGLLETLLFEVERFYSENAPQPYLEILYKAMFGLAYYGLMRVGELTKSQHVLKACNIHVGHNKDKVLLTLYSSKTHGYESGPQKIRISATQLCHKRVSRFFCPVRMVLQYMNIRGNYKNSSDQFFVFADKSPVLPIHLRSTLRCLLDRISLNSDLYDVHSFRIGRTSDLAKYGYSIPQIKAMGRWRSNAAYKYIRN